MNEFIDNYFWWLIIVGWNVFTIIGVSLLYWICVIKEWIKVNDTLWTIMMVTIFFPIIIYSLIIILLTFYLPRKYAIKLKLISENGK
jgi:ABC-type uncharacterized transport system permease subunit